MRVVCCVHNALPLFEALRRATVMNIAWRQKRKGAVAMLCVIPADEDAAELAHLNDVGKRRRELGLIFRGFEERLDVRVVVADVRPRMALGHAEIGEKEGNGL